MARGKIYTNRKKTLRIGEEKNKKKQTSKSKKDKKESKQDKKPVATDVFDYRTGVVYSIRPEDTNVHLLEEKVTSFLKEKGAIEDPKEFLTTAVYLGEPSGNSPSSVGDSEAPHTVPPSTKPPKTSKVKMSSSAGSQEVTVTFWREVKDTQSNNTYYWNPDTNQTSWTLPENAVITSEASERSEKIADPETMETTTSSTGPDLVKAYNHIAQTMYGVNNGTDNEPSTSEKKSKKGKKQKLNSEEVPLAGGMSPDLTTVKGSKSRSSTGNKAESPMLKIQVSNLSDEIFRKLEYLHVSREKVTDLQKLQIQLETRMEDWKDEELSSKFFLSKLKNASDQVNTFVQQEVPSGWTCEWDRASCRYYFNNSGTGEVSWEFPVSNHDTVSSLSKVDNGGDEKDASSDDDDGASTEEDHSTTHVKDTPVITPPGPPPPLVNPSLSPPDPPPPVVDTTAKVDTVTHPPVQSSVMDLKPDDIAPKSEDISKADTPPMQLYDDIEPPKHTDTGNAEESQEKQPPLATFVATTTQPTVNSIDESNTVTEMDIEEEEVVNSGNERGTTQQQRDDKESDDDDDERYKRSKKQTKRARHHSDSDDSYGDQRRTSSSYKRSRRRHGSDSYNEDSDHSDGGYKRRRSRSRGDRRRSCSGGRSDSDERYSKKSRSSKYSRDNSDNDQYSSKRRRQRSSSRGDHGSRKDKKKKKDKKKHRHHDSSSGDEYHSRKSSKSSKHSKERNYDFGGSSKTRDSQSKEHTPTIEKKAFVPAKFKPKPKGRDGADDSTLSATQMEMMQNIANVTGGGAYMMGGVTYPPVLHPSDPQYAAYYTAAANTPGYDGTTVSSTATITLHQQQQGPTITPVPPPIIDTTSSVTDSTSANTPTTITPEQPSSMEAQATNATTTTPGAVQPSSIVPEGLPPAQPGVEDKPSSKEESEAIMECEMELDDGEHGNHGDQPHPPADQTPSPPIPEKQEQANSTQSTSDIKPAEPMVTAVISDTPTIPIDTPTMASAPIDTPTVTQPAPVDTSTVTVVPIETTSNTEITPTSAVEPAVATPTSSVTPPQPDGDSTPPLPSDGTPPPQQPAAVSLLTSNAVSAPTYSNPPTTYTTTAAYDPNQQAAYAAYSQQYYGGNPYQYYTDPAQYAAAMNYYAAYQAAYTSTYNAYYQQQGINPGAAPGGTSTNPGDGQ